MQYLLDGDECDLHENELVGPTHFFLFKHITNCLPQKHLGLSRGLTIIH